MNPRPEDMGPDDAGEAKKVASAINRGSFGFAGKLYPWNAPVAEILPGLYEFSNTDREFIASAMEGWASEWDGTTRAAEGQTARDMAKMIRGGHLFLRDRDGSGT